MPVASRYAQLSWSEVVGFAFSWLKLPLVLTTTLITSPFHKYNKHKPWRRVLSDCTFRWVASLTMPQFQTFLGTTEGTYCKAVQQAKLQPVTENLDDDGVSQLLWIGPKGTDNVLLYLHGGGFIGGVNEASIRFWRYVQQKLKSGPSGIDLHIVILKYSLIPEGRFPTPLRQSVLAIEHLLASGVSPSKLHLAGDSAGGNLIMQVLLHTQHPVDGVPPLDLPAPIGGALLLSPWASLTANTASRTENDKVDICTARACREFGDQVLYGVPEQLWPYLDPVNAPESWFTGMERAVQRVLITAGSAECLRDEIVMLGEIMKKHHSGAEVVVQHRGVHVDPMVDFLAYLPEKQLGSVTPMIIQWFVEGYRA
ncbi:hypothetical protein HGRIS_002879 [Hohenbuehelia grisea]|uniref:Alpha/beta hydrolase fold-3 domain-containing protein n=1 Tax=Hohenbuehelia grisea TaxID=104357 RepID=A0ABR3JMS2_9AGAR